MSPRTAVNVVKALGLAKTLKVPKANQTPKNPDDKETGFVEVRPPKNSGANDAVNIRIISHELRKGMVMNNNLIISRKIIKLYLQISICLFFDSKSLIT